MVTVWRVDAGSVEAKPPVAEAKTLEAEDWALAMTEEMLERTADASLLADAAMLDASPRTEDETDVMKPDAVERTLEASLGTEVVIPPTMVVPATELAIEDASMAMEEAAELMALDAAPGAVEAWLAIEEAADDAAFSAEERMLLKAELRVDCAPVGRGTGTTIGG